MHSIKGTKTEANLIAAFNGETQANTKYTLFATKARNDGYNEIANIFEQTAKNELAHARLWYKYLHSDEMPDTQTNLTEAVDGENFEWVNMYPEFSKTAAEEGFTRSANGRRKTVPRCMRTSTGSSTAAPPSRFSSILRRRAMPTMSWRRGFSTAGICLCAIRRCRHAGCLAAADCKRRRSAFCATFLRWMSPVCRSPVSARFFTATTAERSRHRLRLCSGSRSSCWIRQPTRRIC